MFAKTYLSSIALALMHYKTANGLVISYPEVIPGPGLPSLASLGLTSAELYNMKMPNICKDIQSAKDSCKMLTSIASLPLATRAANFNPVCGPVDFAYVNVNGIIACYHYLDKLGHQNCVTPEHMNIAHFCYAGDAEVSGQATSSRSASSYW